MSKNDPFENIRRMQEVIRRLNYPLVQYQKQISILNIPAITQMNQIQESMSSMLKSVNEVMANNRRALRAASKATTINLELLKSTLEKISNLNDFDIPLPDPVIPHVEDLIDSLEPLVDEEVNQELNVAINITINNSVNQTSNEKWWIAIFSLILTIAQFLYPIYQDHIENIKDQEKQIVEEKHKDEVIEKFNELIEIIQPLISEHSSEEEPPSLDSPE